MYEPGDYVPGVGLVQANHVGLPWPVGLTGGTYFGVVCVARDRAMFAGIVNCDAKSGEVLSDEQLKERLNNKAFDYEGRMKLNTGRRYAGNPRVEVWREMTGFQKWRCRWRLKISRWWHGYREGYYGHS